MCSVIACFPGCDFINFEINLSFFVKPFSYVTKKLEQKLITNSSEQKALFRGNKKQTLK